MGINESNRWYADLLGWVPEDFGCSAINAELVVAIRHAQERLKVEPDGACGPLTYRTMPTATTTHDEINAAPTPSKLDPGELIGLDRVRTRLAWVWLVGAGATVVLLILQSLLQRFGDATPQAWGWLLPTILPTFSIIVTVLTYTALDPVRLTDVVRKDFFHLATALSVAYLALVALTILIGPFVKSDGKGMLALMQMSNLWLGPIQGVVASALGVLFVTREKKPQERGHG